MGSFETAELHIVGFEIVKFEIQGYQTVEFQTQEFETVVVEIVLFGIVEFEIVGLGIVEFEMFNIVSLDGIQTYFDIFVTVGCLLGTKTAECLAVFGNFEFLTC